MWRKPPELTETQSSSLAQVVGHKYIDNLPLPNRSANSLVSLSPGVVLIDPGQGAENYPVFSIAGGGASAINISSWMAAASGMRSD